MIEGSGALAPAAVEAPDPTVQAAPANKAEEETSVEVESAAPQPAPDEGLATPKLVDFDGDGLSDEIEGLFDFPPRDSDGDEILDAYDPDSDNDGLLDLD